MTDFVHLHLHTEYSLLDGYARIDKVVEKAKELGMQALAITDHGTMFGVVQFYKKCKEVGIKPIIGCEVYISEGDYRAKNHDEREQYHLIILAENLEGYHNLIKIVSEGYINGYYYKPRVDKSVLKKYSKGIIATSACLAGEIPQKILEGNYEKAEELAYEYKEIFGKDNFFLELQDHGIKEQKLVNKMLMGISKKTGLGLVATNDCHYVNKEDAQTHDVLLCIQTARLVNDEDRMRFPSKEFYLKSPDEMKEILGNYDNAIENTEEIAKRCNVELEFGQLHLPHFESPQGFTNKQYLRHLTFEGIKKRYANLPEADERAERELSVIEKMGYTDYFLIVWDFINYARSKGIPVGPGRGSAAGAIVSYALGITNIDPLKYNLLFERFLNPERVSMPDIDIDFCYERREEVIKYVIEKYGEENVSQIVTFGTMQARGAIRDVGRVLDMPYNFVDKVAKMIPIQLGITIEKALNQSEELRKEYESSPDVKKLIDTALSVEAMPRHTSTHAAGVVITENAVTDYVPLSRNADVLTTQYNMIEIEELGLLKMDFLGLRTLTVISDAVKLIKINHGIDVDIDKIDFSDAKVLGQFTNAETLGIFQFESVGMRAFLKELKPTEFEDLIAANSLFRPGPMSEIPTYIKNKHNPDKIVYLHPKLEPILKLTYGTIVYQEQVMQIVQQLAGYTLGGADLLRRAMSKKKMATMEEHRKIFIYGKEDDGKIVVDGCIRRGVDEEAANKIYDLMIDFAKYAFNKSHSAAYAYVAFQTAWLKYYYPAEFMASIMTSVMGQTANINLYIRESKRLGIEILPPDVNSSYKKFSVDGGKIRFGLRAIKNVGAGFADEIIKARGKSKFTSFFDFIEKLVKIDSNHLNKKAVECLIKVGACDSFGYNRATLIANYERIIDATQNKARKNVDGQMSLMDNFFNKEDTNIQTLTVLNEYPKTLKLEMEKELTGLYITDHPLSSYTDAIKSHSTFNLSLLAEDEDFGNIERKYDNKTVTVVGLISARNDKITKNNQQMAFIELEDEFGLMELVVFPTTFDKFRSILLKDSVIIARGRLNISENENPKMILESVKKAEENKKTVFIRLKNKNSFYLDKFKDLTQNARGTSPVVLYYEDTKKAETISATLNIDADNKSVIYMLNDEYGNKNIVIK